MKGNILFTDGVKPVCLKVMKMTDEGIMEVATICSTLPSSNPSSGTCEEPVYMRSRKVHKAKGGSNSETQIRKRKGLTLIMIIIAILIIVSVVFFVFYSDFRKKSNSNGITAMEGYSNALEEALKWDSNAKLIRVRELDELDKGKCPQWMYIFIMENDNNTFLLEILVSSDGFTIAELLWEDNELDESVYIKEWKIDSNQAYEIAKTNGEINRYLKNYASYVHVESFSISCYWKGETLNHPQWYIEWYGDVTGDEDYKEAEILIDGTNGDILYAYASK